VTDGTGLAEAGTGTFAPVQLPASEPRASIVGRRHFMTIPAPSIRSSGLPAPEGRLIGAGAEIRRRLHPTPGRSHGAQVTFANSGSCERDLT